MEYRIDKKTNIQSMFDINNDSAESVEKLRLILLALFGAALPFDIFYTTLIIFLLVITMLIDFSTKKINYIPRAFWIFTGAILLSGIGYFYSTDTWRASYLIERQLVIFIFPILIPLMIQINKTKLNFILWIFSISCTLSVLYLLFNNLSIIFEFNFPIRYLFTSSFFNHNFTAPLGIHATYMSLYLSVGVVFLLKQLTETQQLNKRFLIGLLLFILFIALFFLSSRTIIIALLTVIAIVFPLFFIKNKMRYLITTIILIIVSFAIGSQSNYIKKRFSTELAGDLVLNKKYTVNDPEPRILRWRCAMEIIEKKPLFGHGTGEEIGLLKEKYLQKNMMLSYSEAFNTHNQYLAVLIKNGILGLIAFLLMLFYFFRIAIKAKDFIYFSFLIILSIGFFTENIIDANKGIFFFAFFNTLLGYNCLYQSKQKEPLKATE